MASPYLDLIEKFQEQSFTTLKLAQTTYLESLNSAKTMIEKMPTVPQFPKIEGLPTVAELTEVNTAFLDRVVAHQKAFAKELADVFTPVAQ
jgi:hypothetical protein